MAKWSKPEEKRLSNGIPVIFQPLEGTVGTFYWWIQTGSADEGKKQEGFAHFLEHMLFKDASAKETGVPSTGQTAFAIESLGGDINAYTSFDQTVYHVTCAEAQWEKVIDLFGTMAKPQKFLKADFTREREVILEELRKNEDSPGRQMFQSLFSATYSKHPYGRPVIGFTKTLKAAHVSDLERFYRSNYVSERMGLVMVGPFGEKGERVAGLMKVLEKRFGQKVIPQKAGERIARPIEQIEKGKSKWVVNAFDVKTPSVAMSFRVPDLQHPDVPALDLLAGVLGSGESSRLYQKLFYGKSVVTDASTSLYVPKDPGIIYVDLDMDDLSKIPAAVEGAVEELARIKTEGPTEEELARVIANVESERLYATQSADGMASRLGFLRFVLGDLRFDREYLEDLKAVTTEDVTRVAREYLKEENLSAVLMVPKENAKYDLKPLQTMVQKALKSEEKPARVVVKTKLAPQIFQRASGIRVAHLQRSNSHVFSAHLSFLGGLRLESGGVQGDARGWGASHLFAQTWPKGTDLQDSKTIAAFVEGKAAGLEGFSGRNSSGLQITGLAKDWGSMSSLLTEVLTRASFPQDEIDHSKRVTEDSIRGIDDHSAQLCSKLFLETLFEKHPYGKMMYGSLESVQAITREQLQALHRRWVRPERLVISVSGDVSTREVDEWVTGIEKDLQPRAGVQTAAPAAAFEDEADLKAPRWVERNLAREQLHLIVGGLGTRIGDPNRYVLRILQNVLGGQSGRLFIELREKKSLAYTVSPMAFEGMERGYVGTYIACSPSKRQEALDGIREVLEKLADKGPTATELKRAKLFYLGHRAMDLQSDPSLATHFGLELLYGNPISDESKIEPLIQAVTGKQIQDFCRRYLIDPPMVTSVVG